MAQARLFTVLALVTAVLGFHLFEWATGRRSWFGEITFLATLVVGVGVLAANLLRLRLIHQVNQLSSRAREIIRAGRWEARVDPPRGRDLADLGGAVNGLLEAADASQRELRASERRLASQSEALTDLTARHAATSVAFAERLRQILERCAATLGAERTSLWRFTDARDALTCVNLYEQSCCRHQSGERLERQAFPEYFAALDGERVIAASDARQDPRTAGFRASYLDPRQIGAMLDVPLRKDDRTIGVLCVEHVGGPRAWTYDEQNFTIAVANLVVVALADEERLDALARLEESEARARLILDSAHDVFIGMNSEGRIVSWNAQAVATFGWAREEAMGQSLAELIIPRGFREAHLAGLRRFHETGNAPVANRRLELRALHREGHEFPIEITISTPLRTSRGHFFGAFLRDISERLRHEEELRTAKEAAEAATKAKSEFLANMSHELRTPLNGVLGYAQLLQRDRTLSASQREALDAISACGAHLLDLINDVLDLSKIEAGRIDVEAVATDLEQVAMDVRYVMAERAQRKGLAFRTEIAPGVPRWIRLDGRHVRQVLLNLLGNAVKFTAHGEVRLAIAAPDPTRIRFEVIDTGVGIEAEHLTIVFQAFRQTRAGAEAGGSGLGLTISQRLVKAMGGQLEVESVPGRGSRFSFELPLLAAPEQAAGVETAAGAPPADARLAPGQELTALVADDSSVNRRILASLLESAGVRVIVAAGGFEAVDLARQHRPDVILMDLRMSDLNGFEATRRIHADPATQAIPVLAVTASAWGDVRQAAKEAGCADFVPKPVRADVLFAKLQQHARVRFTTTDAGRLAPLPAAMPADVRAIAGRLRRAAAIGDITQIEALAHELAGIDDGDLNLGARVAGLASAFDFEAVARLADALEREAR
jgi:PAS domain S-box-containing protein